MKVVFDVKNVHPTGKIEKDSILLYNAVNKNWYITSKKDLLEDFYKKHDEVIEFYTNKINELEQNFGDFQKRFAEQYSQIVELMKLLTEQEGKK